ncbi:MAG: hypothetical protein U0441_29465 [Polyangiaceae bacterium]
MSTAPKMKLSAFSIVTLVLGVVAIALIAWRISKAWNLQYGDGPREPPPPIPTGGSYGPPGIVSELPLRNPAPTSSATAAPGATAVPGATAAPGATTTSP